MNLFVGFDKTAKAEAAAALSSTFFERVIDGSAVRYQNHAVEDRGIYWLVTAEDTPSLKAKIEKALGEDGAVVLQSANHLIVVPSAAP